MTQWGEEAKSRAEVATMIQFFTALLVFSHFNPDLPKPSDVQNLPKPALVKMYSGACLAFFKKPEFQGYDLAKLTQNLLQSMAARSSQTTGFVKGQVNSAELIQFYNKVCKANPDLAALNSLDREIKEALNQYNILKDQLPETDFKKISLQQATDVLSADKKVLADIYIRENRRRSVRIDRLPPYLPKIIVAVEDGRFFDHKGVDEIGILRAVLKDVSSQGARQGASTISQQVARNLYLGFTPSLRRKLQEILIADRMERQLSKSQILELYLNLIYFGRNSWGIEKAAQSYFGKSAAQLSPIESAFLAGIVHGPNLYRNRPDRIERRVRFVLARMKEKSLLPSGNIDLSRELKILPEGDPYNAGYIRDASIEVIRKVNPSWLFEGNYQFQTSIDSRMQALASEALQEGLMRLEKQSAKPGWKGPLDNIKDSIARNTALMSEAASQKKLESEKQKESLFSNYVSKSDPSDSIKLSTSEKVWTKPLSEVSQRFPTPASSWRLAVYLAGGRKVGLLDSTDCELSAASLKWASPLSPGDVVFVQPVTRTTCEVVQPPQVNGAVVVMEADSGRLLAMSGGFSYLSSSWNRAMMALRQPGSLMKPFTYLAALQRGIQPNVLLSDDPVFFPPPSRGAKAYSPENFGRENGPPRSMRWAIENSRNVMTIRLATQVGLNPIRRLTEDFGLYESPAKDFPFVLGAQEVTLVNIVRAYAEIANQGHLINLQLVDQVLDSSTNTVASLRSPSPGRITSVDDISLFQLRYLLQGVVARGTAARLSQYSQYFAGKTGTSNESKDVWFIGFTPHIVIGVYIGYDNPETLGARTTGGGSALPIVEKILAGSFHSFYLPEIFPNAPPGVEFRLTNRFTGEIVQEQGPDTILEAYREGTLKEQPR